MAEIKATLTEDAIKYLPQLICGGLGTPASQYSGFTVSDTLLNLSAGDLFWYSDVLYRVISVANDGTFSPDVVGTPTTTHPVTDNVWVVRESDGVARGLHESTVVVKQHGFSVMPIITSFKIGEGGWIDLGAGAFPREPDYTLRRLDNNIQDIDAVVDNTRLPAGIPSRYLLNSRNFFEKYIDYTTDVTFVEPSTARVRCRLEATEFNDDGFGNNPELWEIGLFSEHPTEIGQRLMVAYATFPKQTKTNSVVIENFVEISFNVS